MARWQLGSCRQSVARTAGLLIESSLPRPACGARAGVRAEPLKQKVRDVAGQGSKARCACAIVAALTHASRVRVVDTPSRPATRRLQVRPPGADRSILGRLRLPRAALYYRTRWRSALG